MTMSVGGFGSPPPTRMHGSEGRQKPPSFEDVDTDSSGTVSLDEFKAAGPKDADASKAEAMFKSIDTNGDGSITKAEDDAFRSKMKEGHHHGAGPAVSFQAQQLGQGSGTDLDQLFASLDANGDGSVTSSEFKTAMTASSGTSDAQAQGSGNAQVDAFTAALSSLARNAYQMASLLSSTAGSSVLNASLGTTASPSA